ncbi:MAG: hypothetical protein EOO65_04220 [Methanosarcinales archaeon]|nr:MAG: hypothetical protein EOO65_04220 [Methanosarcinales archaeon]
MLCARPRIDALSLRVPTHCARACLRAQVHYLKTWFVVDFIGAIPFDYIVFTLSQRYYAILQGTKALRILKLLRLFRLLRLHNLYRFLGALSGRTRTRTCAHTRICTRPRIPTKHGVRLMLHAL